MQRKVKRNERGQILIMCALYMVILMIFVGLAVDFGLAYLTRARLSKAVDAAALTGARYSAQGQTQATNLALSSFAMNYGSPSLDVGAAPVPTITFPTDPSGQGNTLINVSAQATIGTSFLGLLPGFSTLNVSSAAQAESRRVLMTLLLDRTGSMLPVAQGGEDGGSLYLGPAVTDFIGYFDNTYDSVAMVSFANNSTVDVPMQTGGFQQPIINAANNLPYQGGTFSDGGMQLAFTTETGFAPPAGTNPQKVVVFFTDGNANTVEGPITCNGGGNQAVKSNGTAQNGTWNFGGTDTVGYTLFLSTNNTTYQNTQYYPLNSNPRSTAYSSQDQGPWACSNGGQDSMFTTLSSGQQLITWTNVTTDARNRVIADANNMRANGITVYAVGLGGAFTPVDQGFLCQVANDPCAGANYNANNLPGAMEYAATGDALDSAFQTIASIIRLRLTQ
jgi:Flp pilus assembly protein TadG